jgi:predicted Zn finger-like uncharacterized protein
MAVSVQRVHRRPAILAVNKGMALATQCPHCNTLFRVAHDQLKLRGGIVRCGSCNEIFDGNAALVDVAAGIAAPAASQANKEAAASASAAFDAAVSASAAFDLQVSAIDQAKANGEAIPVYTLDFNSTFDPLGILPKAGEDEAEQDAPAPGVDARQTELNLDSGPKGDPDLDLDFDVEEDFAIPASPPVSTVEVAARLERVEPQLDMVIDEPPPAPAPTNTEPAQGQAEPVMAAGRAEPAMEYSQHALAVAQARIEPSLDDAAPAADLAETAMPQAEAEAITALAPPMDEDDDAGIVIDLPPELPPELNLELAPPLLDMEEPGFVKRGRQQEKWRRAGRWLMAIGSVLLVACAVAQGVREMRNEMAAQFPALRVPLQAACRLLACQVQLPTQVSKLSIDLGELQTLPGGMFSLTTQVHNQSNTLQTWPHIDLVLKDPAGKPVLRRIVTPGEYLPTSTDPSRGFPARTDQNIKLYFALDQVQATDYNIVVFYP